MFLENWQSEPPENIPEILGLPENLLNFGMFVCYSL